MAEQAPGWVVPLMRAGYSARGVLYIVVGGLALAAAVSGGQAEGSKGALAQLRSYPLGIVALWLIAAGLLAYAIWRLVSAWMDLEDKGSKAKGLISRAAQVASALVMLGLSIQAAALALGTGSSSGGGGGGADSWTAKLMSMPFGRWLVAIAGAIVVAAGIYYAWKGIAEKYRENLRSTPLTEKLKPVLKAGLIAHGVVIAIIGSFLLFAAWHANASEAGSTEDAFALVRQAAFGRVLLGLLALGTLAFAIFCFVQARYTVIRRAPGQQDVVTIARRAMDEARGQAAAATS